ncbi:MAG: glycosyltransferase, partial [Albidovulum sp.]
MKTISIISPCYNEEDNVETCDETVKAIFESELPDYLCEHIIIDNCSSDRTVEILREIAERDPSVKVVVNARNFGVFRSTFNGL